MRTLYILRHAQAESGFSVQDHQRSLTDYGIQQAQKAGQYLEDIDAVLCSSAKRTVMTMEEALSESEHKVDILEKLYNSSTTDLLNTIKEKGGKAQNLLVVAHNPGIHMLAHDLVDKRISSQQLEMLSVSYPPCTLTIVECEIDDWSKLSNEENNLLDYKQINLHNCD